MPGVWVSREVSGEVWHEDSGMISTLVTHVLVFVRGLIFVVWHLCISLYARSASRGEILIRWGRRFRMVGNRIGETLKDCIKPICTSVTLE